MSVLLMTGVSWLDLKSCSWKGWFSSTGLSASTKHKFVDDDSRLIERHFLNIPFVKKTILGNNVYAFDDLCFMLWLWKSCSWKGWFSSTGLSASTKHKFVDDDCRVMEMHFLNIPYIFCKMIIIIKKKIYIIMTLPILIINI